MQHIRTLVKNQTLFDSLILILSGSFLLSIAAHIRIPLFFTPIPLVLQNSIAVLLGAFLGPKKGALSVLLFLLYGAFSCPVFAGGASGIETLFSPLSAGYLFGYMLAAYFTGELVKKGHASLSLALIAGHLSILLLGSSILALFIGIQKAFLLGFLPFIATDILKSMLIAKCAPRKVD